MPRIQAAYSATQVRKRAKGMKVGRYTANAA
jgi:hypothetical protein